MSRPLLLPLGFDGPIFVGSDAEIFPGPEEQHAIEVACRQELARQAVHLLGRRA